MSRNKVKVGIIGLGAIGSVHADAYHVSPDAEITVVCDISDARLAEIGNKYNVKQRLKDYRDLLKTDIDAVSICVGNVLHREVAVAALKAGKHILLEKPMAMNAREAAEITAAGKKAKKVIQIGMMWRHSQQAMVIRDYIQKGLFGDIYHLRTVMIRRRGIPGLGGWFTTKSASGGGPLIDLGVHWFDVAMHISGLWKPTQVSAMNYAKFGKDMRNYRYISMWAGPPNYNGTCDVEDYSVGLVRFGKKASMAFEIAWAANMEGTQSIDILGSKGGARLLCGGPMSIFTEHNGQIVNMSPLINDSSNKYHRQADIFIKACRGECPPAATAEEGLTVMKLIDAVYASGKSGREVTI
ncbi:MAG: Gfo/Idh/MocA family oxidoreductase [Kiritimatiellia bacterium]|nr:Gfo/Idh/MocA family oxidoreductase [Kiritimatiellia bacterium]